MQDMPKTKTKQALRLAAKSRRAVLPEEAAAASDREIFAQVTALPEYLAAKTIFCFVGREDEIDTLPLIAHALAAGKRVAVPLCRGKGRMEAREITGLAALQKGSYGILEPGAESPVVSPKGIDLALLPCVACDLSGNRLGYGGGYYDRFLAKTHIVKAVLCRQELLCPAIPADEHDVPADLVVTEGGVVWRRIGRV